MESLLPERTCYSQGVFRCCTAKLTFWAQRLHYTFRWLIKFWWVHQLLLMITIIKYEHFKEKSSVHHPIEWNIYTIYAYELNPFSSPISMLFDFWYFSVWQISPKFKIKIICCHWIVPWLMCKTLWMLSLRWCWEIRNKTYFISRELIELYDVCGGTGMEYWKWQNLPFMFCVLIEDFA